MNNSYRFLLPFIMIHEDSPPKSEQNYTNLDKDAILDQMGDSLSTLKQQALGHQQQLKSHNEDLEEVHVEVQENVDRTKIVNSKLTKIINNPSYQKWCALFLGLVIIALLLVIIYGHN